MCDPVCVSTPGHFPLVDNAVEALIDEILPLATLITPNKSEAEPVLSHKQKVSISSLADSVAESRELLTFGSKGSTERRTRNDNDGGGPRAASDGSRDLGVQVRTVT